MRRILDWLLVLLRLRRRKVTAPLFEPVCIRVTEIGPYGFLGLALVRKWPGVLKLEPVIESGKVFPAPSNCGCSPMRYKAPDKFMGWSFALTLDHDDEDLENLLTSGDVALELWTEIVPSSDRNKWIHWVFPRTNWKREEHRKLIGQSLTDHSGRTWGTPDNSAIPEGAMWKTSEKPPLS